MKACDIIEMTQTLTINRYKEESSVGDIVKNIGDSLHSFSNNLTSFSNKIVYSMTDDGDMNKRVAYIGNELRDIENKVIRYLTKRMDNGMYLGVYAYKQIEEEKIPCVTGSNKDYNSILDVLEKINKKIKETKSSDLSNFNLLSKYLEKLLNSEDERTSKLNKELDDVTKNFKSTSSEIDKQLKTILYSNIEGLIPVKKVISTTKDYELAVKRLIAMSNNFSLSYVTSLQREIDKIKERVDHLVSYIQDGTFVLSKEVSDRLSDILDTFSKFISNSAIVTAIYIELAESVIACGKLLDEKMSK